MSEELAKWVVGTGISIVLALVGGVTATVVMAYRIGRVHHQLEQLTTGQAQVASDLKDAMKQLAVVAVLQMTVEQLKEFVEEDRRRHASVFPAMQRELAALKERVDGVRERQASQGDFR